jgi:hypothetical protein
MGPGWPQKKSVSHLVAYKPAQAQYLSARKPGGSFDQHRSFCDCVWRGPVLHTPTLLFTTTPLVSRVGRVGLETATKDYQKPRRNQT